MDTSSNVTRHSPTNSATVDQTIRRPQTSAGNPADDLSVSTTPPSQDERKRTARRESFHLHQSFEMHKQEAQASFLDAVAKGDVEAVRRCKGNTFIDVDARQVRDGMKASPLGHAIFRHDKEMVDALLEIGANPLLPPTDDADKRDPAWHAISEGQPEIFASLIRKEPKILSPERQPHLLISYVMHVAKQRATLKAATEDEKPEVLNVHQHKLYMEKDKPEVIKAHQQKLEGQIKIGKMILDEAPVSGEALLATIKNKDFETFEQLIKSGKFSPPTAKRGTRGAQQAVDPDLYSHVYPIMVWAIQGLPQEWAAGEKKLPSSCLELLLDYEVVPLTKVPESHLQYLKRRLNVAQLKPSDISPPPLMLAMRMQDPELMEKLQAHGVTLKQFDEASGYNSAFIFAAMHGKPELLKYLMEQWGVNPEDDVHIPNYPVEPGHVRLKNTQKNLLKASQNPNAPPVVKELLASLKECIPIIDRHMEQQSAG